MVSGEEGGGDKMTNFEIWRDIEECLGDIDYALDYYGVSEKAREVIKRSRYRINSLANMLDITDIGGEPEMLNKTNMRKRTGGKS